MSEQLTCVVAFRLTKAEYEALGGVCRVGESAPKAARRIVLEELMKQGAGKTHWSWLAEKQQLATRDEKEA